MNFVLGSNCRVLQIKLIYQIRDFRPEFCKNVFTTVKFLLKIV